MNGLLVTLVTSSPWCCVVVVVGPHLICAYLHMCGCLFMHCMYVHVLYDDHASTIALKYCKLTLSLIW